MRTTVQFTALVLGLLPSALAIGGGPDFTSQNGRTRLLGSSFPQPGSDKTFDYVVVGGGNAGLTLAKRLAENPKLSVAVVEAGGYYQIDSGNASQIPALNSFYELQPATVDWEIFTTPQEQLDNREIHYAQGKCLGGGTGRNGMAYQRGTTGSYDLWAKAVGDNSWKLSNIMQYFQKSCKFTPPDVSKRGGPPVKYDPAAYSSSGGPLNVAYWGYYLPVSDYIRKALIKLGLKEIDSIQSGSLIGFSQYPATLNPESMDRDSSETSFAAEGIAETSLQLYIRTLAKKIVFSGKKATGVVVNTAGQEYTLHASKELILAAGPLRTPQLLMVSGVGPQAQLQELGVPVVSALSGVGQHLLDQPGFGVVVSLTQQTGHELFSNATYAAEQAEVYYEQQTGPYSIFGSNYLAWEHLPASYAKNLTAKQRRELNAYPADWPDLQYIFNMFGTTSAEDDNEASIVITLQKPSSLGRITLNSTDTADNPLVDVAWLRSDLDKALAVAGIRRAREIAAATGIVQKEIFPGKELQSDEEILGYLRNYTGTSHHAMSTCKMGKVGDPSAVVDTNGKVLGGIQNLRIVDTSIFPIIPPGQPMSSAYMVAEKLADAILGGE